MDFIRILDADIVYCNGTEKWLLGSLQRRLIAFEEECDFFKKNPAGALERFCISLVMDSVNNLAYELKKKGVIDVFMLNEILDYMNDCLKGVV